MFVDNFGNIPVSEITRAQVLQYREICARRPDTRRLPYTLRERPLTESELQANRVQVITPETVNRYLNSISAMLKWCRSNVAGV